MRVLTGLKGSGMRTVNEEKRFEKTVSDLVPTVYRVALTLTRNAAQAEKLTRATVSTVLDSPNGCGASGSAKMLLLSTLRKQFVESGFREGAPSSTGELVCR